MLELSIETTPTAAANFSRGIKLIQFRRQMEMLQRADPKYYVEILNFLNEAIQQSDKE